MNPYSKGLVSVKAKLQISEYFQLEILNLYFKHLVYVAKTISVNKAKNSSYYKSPIIYNVFNLIYANFIIFIYITYVYFNQY